MSFSAPVVTGYSAFYDPSFSRAGSGAAADYNSMLRYARTSTERLMSLAMARQGWRPQRRIMKTLIGVAPGATALEVHSRVQQLDGNNLGGLRPIESVTDVNAATTAANVTYINTNIIDSVFTARPSSYPADLSGNGGGGKLPNR